MGVANANDIKFICRNLANEILSLSWDWASFPKEHGEFRAADTSPFHETETKELTRTSPPPEPEET